MNKQDEMLTIVIPAFNEQEMIACTTSVVSRIMEKESIPFEVIFIDDGSTDQTWQKIQEQASFYDTVKGISFSKNFGKESAIFAGLKNSEGACCVVMDCDLQHPPETIVEMYQYWKQGYEVVEGVKLDRGKESAIHKVCVRIFYDIMSKAAGADMGRASDFKLMDRKAVDAILEMKEKNAFFRALSSWVGFKTRSVEFVVQERTAGESKWSTWSLVKYALTNISSFSAAPMQMVTFIGIFMLITSFVLGIYSLYQKIMGIALEGFTTIIILQLFSGSIIMVSLGIIGFYIAKIYEEIKSRPRYIISEYCGKEKGT